MSQEYVTHPLIEPNTVEYRKYQITLAEKAVKTNLLCVLPTGTGKTMIAVLATAKMLEEPEKRILLLSPTKPLCAQHHQTFRESLRIPATKIKLVTGEIRPDKRDKLYKDAKVVVATPQTIRNDVRSEKFDLGEFSLVVFDEAQRAVKKYPYTAIASLYHEAKDHPRILGLTASPGSSNERIQRVCQNLFINAVQILDRSDESLRPYVEDVDVDWEYVTLPPSFKKIKKYLKNAYEKKLEVLKEKNMIYSLQVPRKRLVELQEEVSRKLEREDANPFYYMLASKTAAALKLSHGLELLETQGITPLFEYLQKLKNDETKAARRLMREINFIRALRLTEQLHEKGVEHPKLPKLLEIVKRYVENHPAARIIVFVRFRNAVEKILTVLREHDVTARKLVGQRKGLTQDEQVAILNEFKEGAFNVLVTTSVGEEGLDVPSCKLALFYDTVPSAIRSIQRRGRVGRTRPGKVIILIAKGTRDEGYFWSAYQREKKMRKTLEMYQKKGVPTEEPEDLTSFMRDDEKSSRKEE